MGMRIEIFASGGSSVSQMQSGLDSLHSGINATIQALKKTRRKIEYLPGPASSQTSEAMGRLQDRISAEQSKMERVEKLSQDVNAFLGHTAQTDAQVSRTITQNQSKFFAENPWSKPISSGNSSAWDRFLDGWNSFWSDASDAWNGFWSSAIEGWDNFWDDAQDLWNTVKEGWEGFVRDAAEVLKKAWTGVVTFVKEHAVELIVGTVAIVVGAVLIALTAGTATPFLAAFGGALLAGLKAAAVSAVVGGAISTVIAAFTGENLLTAFADGFASGYMWGGIFFAIGAAINFMKPQLEAVQKSLKAKFQSWKESQSWRSESGRILVNPQNNGISQLKSKLLKNGFANKWNLTEKGNEGITHFLSPEYRELQPDRLSGIAERLGWPANSFEATEKGFENFTKAAEYVIKNATESAPDITNITGGVEKVWHYLPSVSNPNKGVLVITKNGKISSIMDGPFRTFLKHTKDVLK